MTTDVIRGSDLILYVGEVAIALSTSCEVSISTNMLDVTNKDSNGWKRILPDVKEWSISSDHMVAYDAAYGVKEILAAQLAGTKLSVKFSTEVTGDMVLSGNVYIDSNNINAAQGSPATFSFSGQGDGELVQGVVPA